MEAGFLHPIGHERKRMNTYKRVARYFSPFSAQIAFALVVVVAGIGVSLLKPWPLKYVIDTILPQFALDTQSHQLQIVTVWVCVSLVVIFLLSGVLNFISNYMLVKIGLKALVRIRTELYSCLQSLPLKFHDARRSGDSTFRVAYDSQAIQSIFNKGFTGVFQSAITLIGTFVVMWTMNIKLTLLSVCILPLVVGVIYFFANRIRKESTDVQKEESDVFSTASEGLGNIRVTHAFGREEHEVEAFQKQAMESLSANLKLTFTNVTSALVISTLMAAGTAVMIYFGTLEVVAGNITLGDLTVFLAYLSMLYTPLEALSYTAWALEGAAAGAQRCFEVLDTDDETKDSPGARKLSGVKGQIEFRNVRFAYEPGKDILKGLSAQIAPGQTVAFVGGTGAGKSTLMALVPRFYDPTAGDVFIDGSNLRDVTKKSLRDNISMVLQDTVLLNATIKENIAYGKLLATDAEIISAAKSAQAHDFIMAQPKGYDTHVGERGIRLSVGQRQRIGIARAFLKDSPILLLDEPSSALDPETEKEIMSAIERLMEGRTTLIITHRISTIHRADLIFVLAEGKLAERGTGQELLKFDGLYKKLFDSQHVTDKSSET